MTTIDFRRSSARAGSSVRAWRHVASLPVLGALCLTILGRAPEAGAQGHEELAGYLALVYTPVGALTPLPPGDEVQPRRSGSRLRLRGRWGRLSPAEGLSNNTIGAGVDIPVGRWTLGGTLGYLSVSCSEDWEGFSDCDSDVMLGASARRVLVQRPLRGGAPSPRTGRRQAARATTGETLVLGFEGTTGFSPRQGEHAMAMAATFPAGIAFQKPTLRITPFLAPGLGYGRLGKTKFDEDETSKSYSSTLMMFGGGVGFDFIGSGFGATIGFQRIMRSGGGGTTIGLAMNWSGSSSRR